MEAGPVGWAQNWAQRRFATVGTRSTTPANPIAEKQMIGGRGGTRTPDPLLAKQPPEHYRVGSTALYLRLTSPFTTVFGSNCSQVVPNILDSDSVVNRLEMCHAAH